MLVKKTKTQIKQQINEKELRISDQFKKRFYIIIIIQLIFLQIWKH